MEYRIATISPKKLLGIGRRMSLTRNFTRELWQAFMTRRKEIKNCVASDLYSLQIYGPEYFIQFNPDTDFEKWAATEVTDFNIVPPGMETINLPGGLYAVFLHKGPASKGADSFQYIFGTWIPQSDYLVDHRPHFEILGEKYKNDEQDSEEEIWIPVRRK